MAMVYIFICVKCLWNETLDHTTTRNGFSSQTKLKQGITLCVIFSPPFNFNYKWWAIAMEVQRRRR